MTQSKVKLVDIETITKSAVWLSNVDNTSDSTKNSANVTLTNKTIALWSNTISWTKSQFDTACTDDNFAFLGQAQSFTATQTFTDVTIWWTTNTLTVNWQNRTSGRTSYTNTITWSWWTTDPSINASDWSYKQIWKTVFVRWWLFWNSWNRTKLDISIPVSANNSVRTLLPNYMTWTWIDKVVFWRMFSWSIEYLWFILPTGANRELYTEFFYEAA